MTRNRTIDGLKLGACVLMVADHLRHVWPVLWWTQVPGRLVLPLFIWSYSMCAHRITWQQVKRLFCWGAAAQVPYFVLTGSIGGNAVLLFAVGSLVAVAPAWLIIPAQFPGLVDYGPWGVLTIALALWVKVTPLTDRKCWAWVPTLGRDFFVRFYVGHLLVLACVKVIVNQ